MLKSTGEGRLDRRSRRHTRFLMLLAEADNNNTLLAELTGKSPGQIGQLKNSKGAFGAQVAASLEKSMGKPEGWMDQWLPDEGGWSQPTRTKHWHLIRMLDELPEDIAKSIETQILTNHRQIKKPKARKKASS